MKLVNTLTKLITEVAAIDDVQRSIKQKNVITINYQGEEYGRGYRDIEPVCLGISKKGNIVFQLQGIIVLIVKKIGCQFLTCHIILLSGQMELKL